MFANFFNLSSCMSTTLSETNICTLYFDPEVNSIFSDNIVSEITAV